MEGRRFSSKKRANTRSKRKGGNKKGKQHHSNRESSFGDPQSVETVYQILCPSNKIGSVIGKGGSIVKSLREETKAKITIVESVPGSDERVIIVSCPSTKSTKKQVKSEESDTASDQKSFEPHCPAQDALLKIHERIIEEDLFGGMAFEEDNENTATVRLLVPNNMVGCLLGKGGDVIQKLRNETGANIRVLPAEYLPICASRNDELVQISGRSVLVKTALYQVSTLLHQNPRKDKSSSGLRTHGGRGVYTGGSMPIVPLPGHSMWLSGDRNSRTLPPMPWMGYNRNQLSGLGPARFDGEPPSRGGETPGEFSMKILCLRSKLSGVINVKQLEQETGASIHVEDMPIESEEYIIRIATIEAPLDPRSPTIEATFQLLCKTSDFSEEGVITMRLLVPSNKVGCIIGHGGQVINEMRRRTKADIRVFSKDDKPKLAPENEELVQVSGDFGVAKDALTEIASRLRVRTLRDGNAGAEPPLPIRPVQGFSPIGGAAPGGGPAHPMPVGMASLQYEYEKVAGETVRPQDPRRADQIHPSSDHLNPSQNIVHTLMSSSTGQTINSQQPSYQNLKFQHSLYENANAPPPPLPQEPTYQQNVNPYYSVGAQQAIYENPSMPQGTYRYG